MTLYKTSWGKQETIKIKLSDITPKHKELFIELIKNSCIKSDKVAFANSQLVKDLYNWGVICELYAFGNNKIYCSLTVSGFEFIINNAENLDIL